MERNAKIVATVGPTSQAEPILRKLIQAGMDVARLNFSHGTHEEHAVRIALLRKLSQELNKPLTILQDLQGPKLRIGNLPAEGIMLTENQVVTLASTENSAQVDAKTTFIPMDVPELARAVKPGNRILMDDGHLELEVTAVTDQTVEARVILGGKLSSHKGVNLPGANLSIPGFTQKDRADLAFGLEQGIDMIAISFVRSAEDIRIIRETMKQFNPKRAATPIIAKLELPEAIENLHEIIHEADGVMVARGDLGVETSPARVPIIQKKIIEVANRHARVVITATQMLDSMIHNPRPTRAEASDVANAIFDGTDAVMLSGETASGAYPLEAVTMMDAIIHEAESNFSDWGHTSDYPDEIVIDDAISMTRAARELAHDRNVAAIAVFTQTGRTATLMSKARPRVPIMAFTPDQNVYHRLGLLWGTTPFLVPYSSNIETMLAHIEASLIASTSICPGQQIVLISGFPVGTYRQPNFALLHTVGETLNND